MTSDGEVEALTKWFRQPDHDEEMSLADVAAWINARPFSEFYKLTSETAKLRERVEELEDALRTSLSEMLEARDRLLCYHARTSGLDHGIDEARKALRKPLPSPHKTNEVSR